jgi:Domain of unknown function (DUF4124)
MNRKLPLLALVLVAASAYAADSQVYKWTDAGGVVHYSDSPPPRDTKNVQTVRISGGDRPHAIGGDNSEGAGATDKPKDVAAGNSSTAPVDAAPGRAKDCQTARSNLELLQGKMPVAVKNADGTTRALDDKARQAQIAGANAQIAINCE